MIIKRYCFNKKQIQIRELKENEVDIFIKKRARQDLHCSYSHHWKLICSYLFETIDAITIV